MRSAYRRHLTEDAREALPCHEHSLAEEGAGRKRGLPPICDLVFAVAAPSERGRVPSHPEAPIDRLEALLASLQLALVGRGLRP